MLLSLPLALLSERRSASGLAGTPVAQVYRRDFGAHLITGVARCMTTHRGWPPQHRAGVFLGERAGPDFYGALPVPRERFFRLSNLRSGASGNSTASERSNMVPCGGTPDAFERRALQGLFFTHTGDDTDSTGGNGRQTASRASWYARQNCQEPVNANDYSYAMAA